MQQYWPQPYAQGAYAQPVATASPAYSAAYQQQQQQTAGAYQPYNYYAQAAQAAQAYNPYAQQQQQQQQQAYAQQFAAANAAAAYRTGGGASVPYEHHPEYYGHAFDNRSAGFGVDSLTSVRAGGARHLNSKARMWRDKVTHYAKMHGISLKEAMIALKGTGVGKGTRKGLRAHKSHKSHRRAGHYDSDDDDEY